MLKARIVWSGQGGELDSKEIEFASNNDHAVRDALIEMIEDQVVAPGDTFTIEEIA